MISINIKTVQNIQKYYYFPLYPITMQNQSDDDLSNDNIQNQNYIQQQQNQTVNEFKQEVFKQYYRYLNLTKKTQNFCKDFNAYQHLNDSDFQQITLIGWVFEIQSLKVKYDGDKEQVCMAPVLYSNIAYPFKNYQVPLLPLNQNNQGNKKHQQTSKESFASKQHIRRNLLCTKANYMKNFMKTFNQIFKESKQYKKLFTENSSNLQQLVKEEAIEWIYCFTSLKLAINDDKLYFMFTNKTKIISLEIKFYLEYIQNMQKSLGFPYSYLEMPLNTNYLTPETLEEGYPLVNLQTHASIIDKLSFTGILIDYIVEKKIQGNAGNRKDKEVVLTIYEDGIRQKKDQLGVAKVIIKLSAYESVEEITKYFKIGYVYFIYNASMSISDTVNITYKLKQKWQNHVLSLGIYKNTDIKYLSELPLTQLSGLKLPLINRNIIKVRLDLVRLQQLFAKVICPKCKSRIRTSNYCHYCGDIQDQLVLWSIALASDETSYAQISLQTNQTIQYFDLTLEHLQEMRKKCIFLQQTKGNQCKMQQLFNFYEHIVKRNPNQSLLKFQKHLATAYIQKFVLGSPRYNVNESFNTQLSEEEKLQFQQSLQSSKQFMKKNRNKIHFNGHTRKVDRMNKKVVSFIKVLQVFE